MMKMPADNGRFGVMAAVAPQKRQCKFGSLYPAGAVVEAATTPSRWDVVCKPSESAVEKAVRFEKRIQPDNVARQATWKKEL